MIGLDGDRVSFHQVHLTCLCLIPSQWGAPSEAPHSFP
jgi:hypothetical protein